MILRASEREISQTTTESFVDVSWERNIQRTWTPVPCFLSSRLLFTIMFFPTEKTWNFVYIYIFFKFPRFVIICFVNVTNWNENFLLAISWICFIRAWVCFDLSIRFCRLSIFVFKFLMLIRCHAAKGFLWYTGIDINLFLFLQDWRMGDSVWKWTVGFGPKYDQITGN